MAKYLGPKTDPANVASQSDVDGKPSLSSTNPTTIQPDASAAVGTGTTAARADHTHAIVAAAAGTITGTNSEGSSSSFSRADHDHQIQAIGAFSARLSADQSVADGDTLLFDAEDLDVSGWHDSSTDKGRYTPQKAGYYLLGTFLTVSNGLSDLLASYFFIDLAKNGTTHRELLLMQYAGYPNFPRMGGFAIVEANGSTDYFTLIVGHNSTSNRTISGGSGQLGARFYGHYLGSA